MSKRKPDPRAYLPEAKSLRMVLQSLNGALLPYVSKQKAVPFEVARKMQTTIQGALGTQSPQQLMKTFNEAATMLEQIAAEHRAAKEKKD